MANGGEGTFDSSQMLSSNFNQQQQQIASGFIPQVSTLFLSQSGIIDEAAIQSMSQSANVSMLGASSADRGSERQYYWLERFHEHLEKQSAQQELQQQERQSSTMSDSRRSATSFGASIPPPIPGEISAETNISRSMPTPGSNITPPHRGTSKDATSTSSMI
jgi:hypothetical protein